jgi:hypothetical protein
VKGEGQIGPLMLNTDLLRRPHWRGPRSSAQSHLGRSTQSAFATNRCRRAAMSHVVPAAALPPALRGSGSGGTC